MEKRDQLFPVFVMQLMGDVPCLPGLFVAGVFSAALSTVSSGLNSLAAVTIQDVIHNVCEFDLSVRASFFITRALAVIYGVISFLVIYIVRYIPGVLQVRMNQHSLVA